MLKKFPRLKSFPLKKFLTHIKIARFVVPLLVLGKWKVSDGLRVYPKKILRRTNKACNAREKGAQGA